MFKVENQLIKVFFLTERFLLAKVNLAKFSQFFQSRKFISGNFWIPLFTKVYPKKFANFFARKSFFREGFSE